MVCQRAITLLREDSVARLAGSLARSAWYVVRRNPPCLPTRSIVSESRSSKESILHWTHDIVERVHSEEPSVTAFAAHICFPLRFRKDLIPTVLGVAWVMVQMPLKQMPRVWMALLAAGILTAAYILQRWMPGRKLAYSLTLDKRTHLSPVRETRVTLAETELYSALHDHAKASSRVLKAGNSRREKLFTFSENSSGRFSAPTHADFLI